MVLRWIQRAALAGLAFAGLLALSSPGVVATGTGIERVSLDSAGNQGNNISWDFPAIDARGRLVAFWSFASNLVPNDTNASPDVFVRDGRNHTTERVSVASDGTQGNMESDSPAISADGRYVAFESDASNLVPNDPFGRDIFVHDRQTGTTTRVSANGPSYNPDISDDGRYVAFRSEADTLVPGDTNGVMDVFVHDMATGVTERVSVDSNGGQSNDRSDGGAISADGRFVAFQSLASSLVAGDTNGQGDVFVHDRQTGATERVSVSSGGSQANGVSAAARLNADGRYVGFLSLASNLVAGNTNGSGDTFVRDRLTGTTERISVDSNGNEVHGKSGSAQLSDDGRFVVFESTASDLVPGDTIALSSDVFVRDRVAGTTRRVSLAWDGSQPNDGSSDPVISGDGLHIAFWSGASNLVPNDTNGVLDIFAAPPLGVGGVTRLPDVAGRPLETARPSEGNLAALAAAMAAAVSGLAVLGARRHVRRRSQKR